MVSLHQLSVLDIQQTQAPGSGTIGVLGGSATFNITLACNPPSGPHRMRVKCAFGQSSGLNIQPCTTYGFMEYEDYIITIDPALPCPAPSNLAATATGGGANISWTIGCVETDWDLHVTTPGSGAPTGTPSNPGITTNPYSLAGLDPGTTYEVWLRADCDPSSGGGQSTWLGPVTFTTDPTCFPPTSLLTSNITPFDAEVNFTAPVTGTPAGYEYYVSTSATAPTAATTGTPITGPGATQTTLGGALTPNTLHYVMGS